MNSDIPNAYQNDSDNLDRSSLNIGNSRKGNKKLGIFIFIVISILIILTASYFMMTSLTKPEEVIPDPNEALNASGTQVESSALANNNNFFDALKARKEREKTEAIRLSEESAKRLAQNTPKPIIVKKSVAPAPSVPIQPKPRIPQQRQDNRSKEITPEQRKMSGSLMIPLGTGATEQSPQATDNTYNVTAFENGSASFRGRNALDFLLIHGSVIPCALYTQIISDYEGFVTCRVIQDIYSANGATLLVEKGSLISGRQRVALEQGKSRLFTNWSDIETPYGVSIIINSLGAGRLGASGSKAWIDNHFMERFGGAILLSFIDDGLDILKDSLAESTDGLSFDNSTSSANEMATKALESSINIKPTGYSKIGQRINIIVARDIDLSTVYQYQ